MHIAVVLFFINIAFIIIIKNPQNNNRIQLYEQEKVKRLDLINTKAYVKDLETRQKKLKYTNESLTKFYGEILKPKNKGIVDLRQELADLLKQMGIPKIDINYDNKEITDYNLYQVAISLPIEGNYVNIRKFINMIENSKNFMVIDNVSLSESKAILKLNIRLSAYFKNYETI
jgi:Tfp pilus assembly protein PilO